MNDRREDEARLLAETFHDDWSTGRPAAFARQAAARARRGRTMRRTSAVAGAISVAVIAVAFSWRRPIAESPATPAPTVAAAGRGYEIISDEELLGRLRDRPIVAITTADGHRQLQVIEPPPASAALE